MSVLQVDLGYLRDTAVAGRSSLRQANSSLVLSTLKPLVTSDPERKCFRLIGGVLVQRTVKDVVPALETNYAGIKEVLETLVKTYKGKEEEFASFQREHKIVVSTMGVTGGARGGHGTLKPVRTPREP